MHAGRAGCNLAVFSAGGKPNVYVLTEVRNVNCASPAGPNMPLISEMKLPWGNPKVDDVTSSDALASTCGPAESFVLPDQKSMTTSTIC